MKAIDLKIRKARMSWLKHRSDCDNILLEIKHMLPEDEDYDFDVFMQTDGLCLSDVNSRNYPVDDVINLYNEKEHRLSYNDLFECSI